MVSTYGYTTVAALEAFSLEDFGASYSYTDAQVEAVITQAERLINTFCNTTFTGTIPDAIVSSTLELSYRMMLKRLIKDAYLDISKVHVNTNVIIENDEGLRLMLDKYKNKNVSDESGVDIIPMYRTWRN